MISATLGLQVVQFEQKVQELWWEEFYAKNWQILSQVLPALTYNFHLMSQRVVIVTSKKVHMYADTWDGLPNSATFSHVATNSVVGVKLPEDGNNSCSWSRALWGRVALDVTLKKIFLLLTSTSSQNGAISGIKLLNGNLWGLNSVNGRWNEIIPFLLTCGPKWLKESNQ